MTKAMILALLLSWIPGYLGWVALLGLVPMAMFLADLATGRAEVRVRVERGLPRRPSRW